MKLGTLLFGLLLIALSINAQTPSVKHSPELLNANPESAGMSSLRLARIDSMLMESIKNKQLPGAVILLARNGKIVYHKAFGTADTETGRPFNTDDIFRIASQTKAITSTALMMLWEEGRFNLDDPISKYIPDFKNPQVLVSFNNEDSTYLTKPANKEITIRHLLTHTSGLGYGMIDNDQFRKIYQKAGIIDAFTTKAVSLEENIKKLATLPLHHHPGEKYKYSIGIDVLGYFIEVISGLPFDQFLKERIFNPLSMEDTYFYLPDEKAHRLVPVQTKSKGKWMVLPFHEYYNPDYPIQGAKTYFSGGGGLCSTAKDYAIFLQMYLNKGEYNGVRLLSRKTVEVIMANQIEDLWKNRGAYHGLAFSVTDESGAERGGNGSPGTFSWGGYFNTQYFADPEEQLIGIIMKQTYKGGKDDSRWKFKILCFQAIDD